MKGLDIYWHSLREWCNYNYLCFDPAWMLWNLFLALLGVWFGYRLWKSDKTWHTVVWGVLWFFFVPNTIYIVTDIKHVVNNLISFETLAGKTAYILLYTLFLPLGVFTYLWSMKYFKKAYEKHFAHKVLLKNISYPSVVIALNTLFSFGVTLGRFQRTNSWQVVTNPLAVAYDSFAILLNPYTLAFFLGFTIFINAVYYVGRRYICR